MLASNNTFPKEEPHWYINNANKQLQNGSYESRRFMKFHQSRVQFNNESETKIEIAISRSYCYRIASNFYYAYSYEMIAHCWHSNYDSTHIHEVGKFTACKVIFHQHIK